MSRLDDAEAFQGLPDPDTVPLALKPYADQVAELIRQPGVSETWNQRCFESFRESQARHVLHARWQKGRNDGLAAAQKKPARRGTSSRDGLVLICGVSMMPYSSTWATRRVSAIVDGDPRADHTIEAWVPAEFGDDREPYSGGPLPFAHRHCLSLADCYLVLTLVHDCYFKPARWIIGTRLRTEDESELIFYDNMKWHVLRDGSVKLEDREGPTLDDCLARVREDIASATRIISNASSARPPERSPFDDLKEYAEKKLKGNQLKAVVLLCSCGGKASYADLSVVLEAKVQEVEKIWDNMSVALNRKMRGKEPFHFRRHDSHAIADRLQAPLPKLPRPEKSLKNKAKSRGK